MKKFISILILGMILAGCTPILPKDYIPSGATPSQAPLTPTTIKSMRCIPASSAQFESINEGIRQTDQNNSIKSAWAVLSKDFSKVYMVAARIYGPGLNDSIVGVWAISGELNQPGMILAVDGTAQSFSPYPDSSKTKAQITQSDDGVAEARVCALQND